MRRGLNILLVLIFWFSHYVIIKNLFLRPNKVTILLMELTFMVVRLTLVHWIRTRGMLLLLIVSPLSSIYISLLVMLIGIAMQLSAPLKTRTRIPIIEVILLVIIGRVRRRGIPTLLLEVSMLRRSSLHCISPVTLIVMLLLVRIAVTGPILLYIIVELARWCHLTKLVLVIFWLLEASGATFTQMLTGCTSCHHRIVIDTATVAFAHEGAGWLRDRIWLWRLCLGVALVVAVHGCEDSSLFAILYFDHALVVVNLVCINHFIVLTIFKVLSTMLLWHIFLRMTRTGVLILITIFHFMATILLFLLIIHTTTPTIITLFQHIFLPINFQSVIL